MSRSWWLSADWVRQSRSAARVMLPASEISATSRRWRISRSTAAILAHELFSLIVLQSMIPAGA